MKGLAVRRQATNQASPSEPVLAVTTFIIVMIVTPVSIAMPVVIDSVAVFVCVRPMSRAALTDNATRDAHERRQSP
jgi:hypothetical protein